MSLCLVLVVLAISVGGIKWVWVVKGGGCGFENRKRTQEKQNARVFDLYLHLRAVLKELEFFIVKDSP